MKHWMLGALIGLSLGIGSPTMVRAQIAPPVVPDVEFATKVQVSVIGAVKSPGLYQVNASEAGIKRGLFSVMAKAGLGDIEFETPIEIRRGNITLKVDFFQELLRVKALDDPSGVTLQDGDVVVVPIRHGKVSFFDETGGASAFPVLKSKSISLPASGTLSAHDALAMVGYNPVPVPGKFYRVQVFRGGQILEFDLTSPGDKKNDFLLHDWDIVVILLERLPQVTILGHVKLPKSYEFSNAEKLTIADVVKLAGGIDHGHEDDVVTLFRFRKGSQMAPITQFPLSLDANDPKWKQEVQGFDLINVYPPSPSDHFQLLDSN